MEPSNSFNMVEYLQYLVPLAVCGAIAAKWCLDRVNGKPSSGTSDSSDSWWSDGHQGSDNGGHGGHGDGGDG